MPTIVKFGGIPATNVVVRDSQHIDCDVPPGEKAGPVDVTIETPGGVMTLPNAYTYASVPQIVGIVPAQGPTEGGQNVTIYGHGFSE